MLDLPLGLIIFVEYGPQVSTLKVKVLQSEGSGFARKY